MAVDVPDLHPVRRAGPFRCLLAPGALAVSIGVVWLACAALLSARNPVVLLSDAFGFMERARQLTLADASVWVHGFYPFGYPLALRLAFSLTGDYEQAGRLISLASGACSLLAVYAIGALAFSPHVAILGMLVCASNPIVLTYSVNTGTDMAAAACVVAAVAFGMRADRGGAIAKKDLIAAGLLLGLGYLIRYTTLLLLPAFLLWLWVRPRDRSIAEPPREVLRQMAWFILAFVVAASPQLIMSTLVKGRPLWNTQGANVYFGMFGKMNWGTGWQEAAKHPSVAEVILAHPREFVVHFMRNVLGLARQQFVQFPFEFLAAAGLLFSLDADRAATASEASRRLLLVMVVVAFSCGICIAYCLPRYLLCTSILMSTFAAYGFAQCVPRHAVLRNNWRIPVRWPLLLLFGSIVLHQCVVSRALMALPSDAAARIRVATILRDDGSVDPRAVLAIGFDYYDVFAPTKDVFATTWYQPESLGKYATFPEIVEQMRVQGHRYLVMDANSSTLLGWPGKTWPIPAKEWERDFIALTPHDADVMVWKLRRD